MIILGRWGLWGPWGKALEGRGVKKPESLSQGAAFPGTGLAPSPRTRASRQQGGEEAGGAGGWGARAEHTGSPLTAEPAWWTPKLPACLLPRPVNSE